MNLAGKRIACYARYSTDKQSAASCADQIAKCARWVAERGGAIAAALVFRDDGISGAVFHRPGLDALLAAANEARIDVLVVEDLGRLSRDTEDSARIRKLLAHADVRLVALDDGIDTDREGSELHGDLSALFKAQLRREIASKTRRGMEGRARAGFATGNVPIGYRTRETPSGFAIEIDPDRSPTVVEIFELYASGKSLASVASILNARGIAPPRSGRSRGEWLVTSVRAILRNERYIGRWAFGATSWARDPDTRRRKPKKRTAALHVAERPELAIVSEDLWGRVHARFAEHRSLETGPRGTLLYPLSGILKCTCGAWLTINGGQSGRRYYQCSRMRRGTCSAWKGYLRESRAMDAIDVSIRDLIDANRDLIAAMIAAEWSSTPERDERREIEARVAKRQSEIDRAVDFVLAGGSDAVRARLTTLERAQREDRETLASMRTAASAPRAPIVGDVLDGIRAALEGDPATVRAALRDILDGGEVKARCTHEGWVLTGGLIVTASIAGALNHRRATRNVLRFEAAIARAA